VKHRNEAGAANGCLILVLGAVVVFVLWAVFTVLTSEGDCYSTGESGSAQEQRDIERCLS